MAMVHSWYLGIDFSASGLAASLYDGQTDRAYSLYWSRSDSEATNVNQPPESSAFVLPIEGGELETDLAIASFPSYFQGALPCYNRQSRQWEPQFANKGEVISLHQLRKTLQGLLETLNPHRRTLDRPRGLELSEHSLKAALLALEGIVLNCSVVWGDTYGFNLREAILAAELVETPDRIFFLEEAIAIGLSMNNDRLSINNGEQSINPDLASVSFLAEGRMGEGSRQGVLILQGGMITTELALVENLPLESLKHENWALRGLAYGEIDLNCDIFYQLLYPQWLPEQEFLKNLQLEIPHPGESDRPRRDRALLKLENFAEGQSLLETAKRTLLILQKQDTFSTHLGQQVWGVERSALEAKVLWPLYEQFNRQINELLSQKGWLPNAIVQIFCSGQMLDLLLPFIQPWLSQKFPQAAISLLPKSNNSTLIAKGLSQLPRFPQMLDRLPHQYSDYFLLAELLRTLEDEPLTLEQIVKSLERQGIPRACLWRILPFLNGQLPEGFIPTESARVRMTAKSRGFLPYPAIASAPLFTAQTPLYYLNAKQRKRLQQYFAFLLAKSRQTLQDPLAIEFGDRV